MFKNLRWMLALLSTLIISALVQPPLESHFKDRGYHSDPQGLGRDVVNWIESIIGEAAFPWVASSILTATLIFFAAPVLRKFVSYRAVSLSITDLVGGALPQSNQNKYKSNLSIGISVWFGFDDDLAYIVDWKVKIVGKGKRISGKYKVGGAGGPPYLENPLWASSSLEIGVKPSNQWVHFYFKEDIHSDIEKLKQCTILLTAIDSRGNKATVKQKISEID